MLGFTKQELRIVGFLVVSLLAGASVRLYRFYFSDLELAEVDPVFVEKFQARTDSLNADASLDAAGVHVSTLDKSLVAVFPLDINTATGIELQTIPKIGPVLAQKIVKHRNENGRFLRIADLLDVKGIGEKTLERIGPYVAIK